MLKYMYLSIELVFRGRVTLMWLAAFSSAIVAL